MNESRNFCKFILSSLCINSGCNVFIETLLLILLVTLCLNLRELTLAHTCIYYLHATYQVVPLSNLLFKSNYYNLYEFVMRCIHTTHTRKKCGASKGNKEIFLKLLLLPIVLLYVLILRSILFHSQSRVSSLLRSFFKNTAFNALNLNSISNLLRSYCFH